MPVSRRSKRLKKSRKMSRSKKTKKKTKKNIRKMSGGDDVDVKPGKTIICKIDIPDLIKNIKNAKKEYFSEISVFENIFYKLLISLDKKNNLFSIRYIDKSRIPDHKNIYLQCEKLNLNISQVITFIIKLYNVKEVPGEFEDCIKIDKAEIILDNKIYELNSENCIVDVSSSCMWTSNGINKDKLSENELSEILQEYEI